MRVRQRLCSQFAGSIALVMVPMSAAVSAPLHQRLPEMSGWQVELARCWWTYGAWGPHRVCRGHDKGHYDWHPGHWDRHYDRYDYHPGHWDYHHRGHRHHLDEESE
jgi:hypothetical protein